MEDSNFAAAIRLVCNDDKPVYDSEEIFHKLSDRHPEATACNYSFTSV